MDLNKILRWSMLILWAIGVMGILMIPIINFYYADLFVKYGGIRKVGREIWLEE